MAFRNAALALVVAYIVVNWLRLTAMKYEERETAQIRA